MFSCFTCRQNIDAVLQNAPDTAGDLKQRRVKAVIRTNPGKGTYVDLVPTAWISVTDAETPGFFCPQCKGALNLPPEAQKALSQTPAALLAPADFHVAIFDSQVREKVQADVIGTKDLNPRDAVYADGSRLIDPRLRRAVERAGVRDGMLWSHQVESITHTMAGRHVIIVTATASGKTMCFNLPVLRTILQDRDARAIYLYPTKALAQDQTLKIRQFDDDYDADGAVRQRGSFFRVSIGGSPVTLGKYDGSTSDFERSKMRKEEPPNILMTNPDTLHFAILRYHQAWEKFLRNLRYVVVDEIHTYKGVFGSNVALVLRRLRLLSAHYGSNPQFILSSATIGNPLEHARSLTGLNEIALVDRDGSPARLRRVMLLNPKPLESDPNERAEPSTVAVDTTSRVLLAGPRPAKTIIFGKSRWSVKNTYRILKARLGQNPSTKNVGGLIREFTATLTPERREELGAEITSGNVAGVVATSALELGIDIGDISAAVVMGYPGSVASLYQKLGRAGRKGEALGVLVLANNPLEQYYARHAEEFFNRTPEEVRINPRNESLLGLHLTYTLYESQDFKGLSSQQLKHYFSIDPATATQLLETAKEASKGLRAGEMEFVWSGASPSYRPIRNTLSAEQFEIVCDGERVGVMDAASVLRDLFPGAVWTDQDDQFVVQRLDFGNYKAYVKREDAIDYYTVAMPTDEVKILATDKSSPIGEGEFHLGRLEMKRSFKRYAKVDYTGAHKTEVKSVPGYGKLPALSFKTDGVWLTVPFLSMPIDATQGDAGIHTIEHVMAAMLPRFVDCDPSDVAWGIG